MKQIDELQKKLEAAVQTRFADDAINGTYNIARLLITACRERDKEIARLRGALSELVDIYEVTFREETDGLSELRKARAALADTGKTT